MVHVTRLVTYVEVDDADTRQMSVSARHEAVLQNGDRVLLLADRGWSSSGPRDIWAVTSVKEIADTTRTVVGPDEPFGGRSQHTTWRQTTGPPLLRSSGATAWR